MCPPHVFCGDHGEQFPTSQPPRIATAQGNNNSASHPAQEADAACAFRSTVVRLYFSTPSCVCGCAPVHIYGTSHTTECCRHRYSWGHIESSPHSRCCGRDSSTGFCLSCSGHGYCCGSCCHRQCLYTCAHRCRNLLPHRLYKFRSKWFYLCLGKHSICLSRLPGHIRSKDRKCPCSR